jgi:basic membrane protein A
MAALDANGLTAAVESKPTRVVLLLSGVVVDGGWSQLAYEGLERLHTQPNFGVAFAEDITLAQMQQVARGYSVGNLLNGALEAISYMH